MNKLWVKTDPVERISPVSSEDALSPPVLEPFYNNQPPTFLRRAPTEPPFLAPFKAYSLTPDSDSGLGDEEPPKLDPIPILQRTHRNVNVLHNRDAPQRRETPERCTFVTPEINLFPPPPTINPPITNISPAINPPIIDKSLPFMDQAAPIQIDTSLAQLSSSETSPSASALSPSKRRLSREPDLLSSALLECGLEDILADDDDGGENETKDDVPGFDNPENYFQSSAFSNEKETPAFKENEQLSVVGSEKSDDSESDDDPELDLVELIAKAKAADEQEFEDITPVDSPLTIGGGSSDNSGEMKNSLEDSVHSRIEFTPQFYSKHLSKSYSSLLGPPRNSLQDKAFVNEIVCKKSEVKVSPNMNSQISQPNDVSCDKVEEPKTFPFNPKTLPGRLVGLNLKNQKVNPSGAATERSSVISLSAVSERKSVLSPTPNPIQNRSGTYSENISATTQKALHREAFPANLNAAPEKQNVKPQPSKLPYSTNINLQIQSPMHGNQTYQRINVPRTSLVSENVSTQMVRTSEAASSRLRQTVTPVQPHVVTQPLFRNITDQPTLPVTNTDVAVNQTMKKSVPVSIVVPGVIRATPPIHSNSAPISKLSTQRITSYLLNPNIHTQTVLPGATDSYEPKETFISTSTESSCESLSPNAFLNKLPSSTLSTPVSSPSQNSSLLLNQSILSSSSPRGQNLPLSSDVNIKISQESMTPESGVLTVNKVNVSHDSSNEFMTSNCLSFTSASSPVNSTIQNASESVKSIPISTLNNNITPITSAPSVIGPTHSITSVSKEDDTKSIPVSDTPTIEKGFRSTFEPVVTEANDQSKTPKISPSPEKETTEPTSKSPVPQISKPHRPLVAVVSKSPAQSCAKSDRSSPSKSPKYSLNVKSFGQIRYTKPSKQAETSEVEKVDEQCESSEIEISKPIDVAPINGDATSKKVEKVVHVGSPKKRTKSSANSSQTVGSEANDDVLHVNKEPVKAKFEIEKTLVDGKANVYIVRGKKIDDVTKIKEADTNNGNFFVFDVLPEHMVKDAHGKDSYQCDICGCSYWHSFSLKRHIIRNHINFRYIKLYDMVNAGLTTEKQRTQTCVDPGTKSHSETKHISDSKNDASNHAISENALNDKKCDPEEKTEQKIENKDTNSNNVEGEKGDNENSSRTNSDSDNIKMNPGSCLSDIQMHLEKSGIEFKGLFRCHVCANVYDTPLGLRKHYPQHGEVKYRGRKKQDFPCEVCGAIFTGRVQLQKHKSTHLKKRNMKPQISQVCEHCGEQLASKKLLTDHIKLEHPEKYVPDVPSPKLVVPLPPLPPFPEADDSRESKPETEVTGEKKNKMHFSCDKCSAKFAGKIKLQRHMKTHLASIEKSVTSEDSQSDIKQNIDETTQCELCGRSFSSAINLKRHKMMIHQRGRHQCPFCQAVFPFKNNLMQHWQSKHPKMKASEGTTKLTAAPLSNMDQYTFEKREDVKKANNKIIQKKENTTPDTPTKKVQILNIMDPTSYNFDDLDYVKKRTEEDSILSEGELMLPSEFRRLIEETGAKFMYACTTCGKKYLEFRNLCHHMRNAHRKKPVNKRKRRRDDKWGIGKGKGKEKSKNGPVDDFEDRQILCIPVEQPRFVTPEEFYLGANELGHENVTFKIEGTKACRVNPGRHVNLTKNWSLSSKIDYHQAKPDFWMKFNFSTDYHEVHRSHPSVCHAKWQSCKKDWIERMEGKTADNEKDATVISNDALINDSNVLSESGAVNRVAMETMNEDVSDTLRESVDIVENVIDVMNHMLNNIESKDSESPDIAVSYNDLDAVTSDDECDAQDNSLDKSCDSAKNSENVHSEEIDNIVSCVLNDIIDKVSRDYENTGEIKSEMKMEYDISEQKIENKYKIDFKDTTVDEVDPETRKREGVVLGIGLSLVRKSDIGLEGLRPKLRSGVCQKLWEIEEKTSNVVFGSGKSFKGCKNAEIEKTEDTIKTKMEEGENDNEKKPEIENTPSEVKQEPIEKEILPEKSVIPTIDPVLDELSLPKILETDTLPILSNIPVNIKDESFPNDSGAEAGVVQADEISKTMETSIVKDEPEFDVDQFFQNPIPSKKEKSCAESKLHLDLESNLDLFKTDVSLIGSPVSVDCEFDLTFKPNAKSIEIKDHFVEKGTIEIKDHSFKKGTISDNIIEVDKSDIEQVLNDMLDVISVMNDTLDKVEHTTFESDNVKQRKKSGTALHVKKAKPKPPVVFNLKGKRIPHDYFTLKVLPRVATHLSIFYTSDVVRRLQNEVHEPHCDVTYWLEYYEKIMACDVTEDDRKIPVCSCKQGENKPRIKIEGYYDANVYRPRYVCLICRADFDNFDTLFNHEIKRHSDIWCHHIEVDRDQLDQLHLVTHPKTFSIGTLEPDDVHLPDELYAKQLKCTKCKFQCDTIKELHKHIIVCASKGKKQDYVVVRQYKIRNLIGRRKGLKERQQDTKTKEKDLTNKKIQSLVEDIHLSLSSETRLRSSESKKGAQNDFLHYSPKKRVRRRDMIECVSSQQCPGCGKKFSSIFMLERHAKTCSETHTVNAGIRNVHEMLGKEEILGAKASVGLRCKYCQKYFTYKKGLRKHIMETCQERKSRIKLNLLTAEDIKRDQEIIKSDDTPTPTKRGSVLSENDKRLRQNWPEGQKKSTKKKFRLTMGNKKKVSKNSDKNTIIGEEEKEDAKPKLVIPTLVDPNVYEFTDSNDSSNVQLNKGKKRKGGDDSQPDVLDKKRSRKKKMDPDFQSSQHIFHVVNDDKKKVKTKGSYTSSIQGDCSPGSPISLKIKKNSPLKKSNGKKSAKKVAHVKHATVQEDDGKNIGLQIEDVKKITKKDLSKGQGSKAQNEEQSKGEQDPESETVENGCKKTRLRKGTAEYDYLCSLPLNRDNGKGDVQGREKRKRKSSYKVLMMQDMYLEEEEAALNKKKKLPPKLRNKRSSSDRSTSGLSPKALKSETECRNDSITFTMADNETKRAINCSVVVKKLDDFKDVIKTNAIDEKCDDDYEEELINEGENVADEVLNELESIAEDFESVQEQDNVDQEKNSIDEKTKSSVPEKPDDDVGAQEITDQKTVTEVGLYDQKSQNAVENKEHFVKAHLEDKNEENIEMKTENRA